MAPNELDSVAGAFWLSKRFHDAVARCQDGASLEGEARALLPFEGDAAEAVRDILQLTATHANVFSAMLILGTAVGDESTWPSRQHRVDDVELLRRMLERRCTEASCDRTVHSAEDVTRVAIRCNRHHQSVGAHRSERRAVKRLLVWVACELRATLAASPG